MGIGSPCRECWRAIRFPQEFIPELISYTTDGRFPIDGPMTAFPVDRIGDAVEAMRPPT